MERNAVSEQQPRMFISRDGQNLAFTFYLVGVLFLLWGFCNGMIDVMDKHFQDELHLSLAESAWVQFAHYIGYFLMAVPAGVLVERLGYKAGIITGLLIVATGGLWFLAATRIAAFWAFLLGVCVIASGLAFLETVANPYAVVLGHERFAASRINLAQSFNGIGWILGPIAGGIFFYSVDFQGHSIGAQLLYLPYVGVAILATTIAIVFYFAYVPEIENSDPLSVDNPTLGSARHLMAYKPFSMALIAQFLYVGAQAGIFSFFINYITSQLPAIPNAWDVGIARAGKVVPILHLWLSGWFHHDSVGTLSMSNKGAANLTSIAFLCFLSGRLIGAMLMRRYLPQRVLMAFGLINVTATAVIAAKLGWASAVCLFVSYFTMSIMFPTIFALGMQDLGNQRSRASAYLIMTIVGGALLPKLMGYVADQFDISHGFIVPMACFAFIAYYGAQFSRWRNEYAVHCFVRPSSTTDRHA